MYTSVVHACVFFFDRLSTSPIATRDATVAISRAAKPENAHAAGDVTNCSTQGARKHVHHRGATTMARRFGCRTHTGSSDNPQASCRDSGCFDGLCLRCVHDGDDHAQTPRLAADYRAAVCSTRRDYCRGVALPVWRIRNHSCSRKPTRAVAGGGASGCAG